MPMLKLNPTSGVDLDNAGDFLKVTQSLTLTFHPHSHPNPNSNPTRPEAQAFLDGSGAGSGSAAAAAAVPAAKKAKPNAFTALMPGAASS